MTASAAIRFVRPVRLGEKCIAKARVVKSTPHRIQVDVETFVNEERVFQGVFDMYRSREEKGKK